MRLKMEPSGNGKTPKTPGTSGAQQNGSAGPTSSSRGGHQNGSSSKHRPSKSSSTTTGSATPSPSTSLSLSTLGASLPASSSWPQFRFATTLPLRILVLKDLVGAIIGRGGGTIRQITQETHARVDVHRKESSTPNENVIMIYGNPDNCSQACRRILEVMQQEAKSLNRPDEIQLKILASNNLIGRIIGKGGNTIKRIMQQTDTKITISSANLASQYQLEQIISISGHLENMCKAEVMISQKLRQCFESDCMQYQQSFMYHHTAGFHHSSLPPPPLLPPSQSTGPLGLSTGPYGLTGSHQQPPPPMSYPSLGTSPTCTSLPPSALVGRSSALLAGSSVSSPTSSATGPSGSQTHSVPPTPTQGPSAAFYSPYNLAAFMYPPHSPAGSLGAATGSFVGSGSVGSTLPSPYMNISTYLSPSMLPNLDNIKETVTIFIPNSVVGAIIGRGGSTIREMMSNSGAIIKVAQMNEEESTSLAASESSSTTVKPSERRVIIYGNSFSQSQAQFFVFQKVFTELSNQLSTLTANPTTICPYGDPSILKVEILVPTNQVRRIIGKGGSVITDLQRTSGATIKLSKESTTPSSTLTTSQQPVILTTTATATLKLVSSQTEEQPSSSIPSSQNGGAETTTTEKAAIGQQPTSTTTLSSDQDQTSVYIIGDFYASFNAQRQIRLIVHRSIPVPSSSLSTAISVPSSTTSSQQQSVPSKSTIMKSGLSAEDPSELSDTIKQSTTATTTQSSMVEDIKTSSTTTTQSAICSSGSSTTTSTTTISHTASDTPTACTVSTATTTTKTSISSSSKLES